MILEREFIALAQRTRSEIGWEPLFSMNGLNTMSDHHLCFLCALTFVLDLCLMGENQTEVFE